MACPITKNPCTPYQQSRSIYPSRLISQHKVRSLSQTTYRRKKPQLSWSQLRERLLGFRLKVFPSIIILKRQKPPLSHSKAETAISPMPSSSCSFPSP